MRTKTREALDLFIKKAEKLQSLSFTRSAIEAGFTWYLKEGETTKFETTGPNSEQIDAFVLTLRFFIQKNEHTSFQWLAENVLDDSGLSGDWKQEFKRYRKQFNDYLDQLPPIQVVVAGASSPTRRDILNTFVHGDLSHTNTNKREALESWIARPPSLELLKTEFINTLRVMLDIIVYVAESSNSELDRI